ncbi:MAG: type I-U CRISPR-associated protein Csb2 [Acidobacteriota bacterium]
MRSLTVREAATGGREPQPGNAPAMTVARYRFIGEELPPVEETLSLGELARQYLQGIYGRLHQGAASPILSGRAADGSVIKGHRHAFYLPTDEDGDGKIDHLTIFARGEREARSGSEAGRDLGFGQPELQALDQFTRLRQLGRQAQLRLVLLALGSADELSGVPLLGPAKRWRSATPFVPPRHQKFRGKTRENPPDQLCDEMVKRGLPRPASLKLLPRCLRADGSIPWAAFRLERLRGQGNRGQGYAYGFEIELAEPLAGPLAFGYGAHFGLGLFVAPPS